MSSLHVVKSNLHAISLINRAELIQFLQSLNIKSVSLDFQKVRSIGDKGIAVQYVATLVKSTLPELSFPEAHESIFVKEHGEWTWKSDANLSMFLFDVQE